MSIIWQPNRVFIILVQFENFLKFRIKFLFKYICNFSTYSIVYLFQRTIHLFLNLDFDFISFEVLFNTFYHLF